jgi:biotin carboxylase
LNVVHQQLEILSGRKLSTRDIGLQMHEIAKRIGVDPPVGSQLHSSLKWAKLHWSEVHGVLGSPLVQ